MPEERLAVAVRCTATLSGRSLRRTRYHYAGGGTRTLKGLLPPDFESGASASSATPACGAAGQTDTARTVNLLSPARSGHACRDPDRPGLESSPISPRPASRSGSARRFQRTPDQLLLVQRQARRERVRPIDHRIGALFLFDDKLEPMSVGLT